MMSRKRLMTSANNFERFASQNFATSRNDVIFFVTCKTSRNDAVITQNCQLRLVLFEVKSNNFISCLSVAMYAARIFILELVLEIAFNSFLKNCAEKFFFFLKR